MSGQRPSSIGKLESDVELGQIIRKKAFDRLISRKTDAEERDLRIDRQMNIKSSLKFFEDIFHSMVEIPNWKLGMMFFGAYNLILLFFAAFYHIVSSSYSCNTDFRTYSQAVFFSLQTMSSIGYGASDPYFNNCFGMYFLISLQFFLGVVLSSIAAGVVFARFARSRSRAASILFSKKATISKIDNEIYFEFRCADMREHTLLEAKIRAYAIRTVIDPSGMEFFYRSAQLKLSYPDDGLGGMMMLALPTKCASHQMICSQCDNNFYAKSPLVPPESDASSLSFDAIKEYWTKSNMEVLILVEGIVPSTSGSTQARWSYKIDDIVWQQEFAPCIEMFDRKGEFCCKVNFEKFNELVDISNTSKAINHQTQTQSQREEDAIAESKE